MKLSVYRLIVTTSRMIAHLVGILAVAMEPQARLIGHTILRWKIQLVNRDHSCAVLFDSLKNKATSA